SSIMTKVVAHSALGVRATTATRARVRALRMPSIKLSAPPGAAPLNAADCVPSPHADWHGHDRARKMRETVTDLAKARARVDSMPLDQENAAGPLPTTLSVAQSRAHDANRRCLGPAVPWVELEHQHESARLRVGAGERDEQRTRRLRIHHHHR